MILRILRRLGGKPPASDNRPVGKMFPDLDVMIARRAMRLHNRSARGAAIYTRTQQILARGPK